MGAISVTLQGRLLSCPQRKAQVVDSRGKGGKVWNQETVQSGFAMFCLYLSNDNKTFIGRLSHWIETD